MAIAPTAPRIARGDVSTTSLGHAMRVRCLVTCLTLALALAASQPHAAETAAALPPAPLPGEADPRIATDSASGPAHDDDNGILDMDLEQLAGTDVVVPSMDVEVTSVTKQESTVGRSPAAVFVITSEMIRRSGATSIPEALRMAPGLEVARIDSHTWAITCRGFNDRFANKLLVLVDGRSVYTPLFAGVYWDVQDLMLEDIERIEVVRGPGGTLWGANAVNGVINIITKSAEDTQGALLTAGGGTHDLSVNGVRYGGQVGKNLHWRVYGKHFERDEGYHPEGVYDDWRVGRGGFRMDWSPGSCDCDTVTVQGDYCGGQEGQFSNQLIGTPPFSVPLAQDESVSGANVLARWTHVCSEESDWSLQMYFDQTYRSQVAIDQLLNTFDLEFQHRFRLGSRHGVVWGIGHRQVHDELAGTGFPHTFIPDSRTTNRFAVFVQDEITLCPDRLFLTVGSKFSNNDFTGFEYQPSVRLLWTPDRKRSGWAAISRAVRTPSIIDYYDAFTIPPVVRLNANLTQIDYEDVIAYEIGYREQATERFAWDVALFYNVYEHLKVYDEGAWQAGYLNFTPTNDMRGETYGIELLGQWTMSDAWRLSASYSLLRVHLHAAPNSRAGSEADEGNSPHNQIRFQFQWDFAPCWELDTALRYVDSLDTLDVSRYVSMDVRLGWVPNDHFELSLVGQNLLDSHHREFSSQSYMMRSTEVERALFAKATWRY